VPPGERLEEDDLTGLAILGAGEALDLAPTGDDGALGALGLARAIGVPFEPVELDRFDAHRVGPGARSAAAERLLEQAVKECLAVGERDLAVVAGVGEEELSRRRGRERRESRERVKSGLE
jgi:hypothetical protein